MSAEPAKFLRDVSPDLPIRNHVQGLFDGMLFTTVYGSTSNVQQSEKATGYYEHGVGCGDDAGYLTDISDGSDGR